LTLTLIFGTIKPKFVGGMAFASADFPFGGVFMAGLSYFNYDQMTIFEVEVHSEQLELLKNAADSYDWEAIESEVEPLFKEAAFDFRNRKRSSACPHKDDSEISLQETFPFLDEEVKNHNGVRNPKGAGRKGQSFISYLKAFLLAPVLRVELSSEAIAAEIAGNPALYVACEFTSHPASRTLRDFDQLMCEYGLWDLVHDVAYRKNVEDKVIDEKAEETLNIDNTHLLGYSTPGKYVKECRECELFEDCQDKVSTDETADWYVKGKYKCYHEKPLRLSASLRAHQIGMLQLAGSGAPVGCVVLNGKQYEPDSLKPLLVDVKENHSELDIDKVNGDGIFNSQACRDTVRDILGEDVELFASVNPRNKKDIENPARGIAKITKYGSVKCIAGHDMVFLSKDYNLDSYIFGCPVLNSEARCKLEHMEMEVPEQCECEEECSPNSEIGRIYRVKREMLSQIDWDNPQFSYRFKLVYSLRTKIERLFSRMKQRFKMKQVYKRGIDKIRGHILKFMNLMHILANLTGTYGV